MPGVAVGPQPAVDVLDRTDVDAARGLVDQQHGCVVRHLAADDQLLQVAAGQGAGRDGRAAHLDVEVLDDPAGVRPHGAPVQPPAAAQRRAAVEADGQVVRDRGGHGRAGRRPVLGDVGDPGLATPPGGEPVQDRVAHPHRPGPRGTQARDRLEQLDLAVAGDARDADDLAGAHGQRDVVDDGAAGRRADGQALDRTAPRPRARRGRSGRRGRRPGRSCAGRSRRRRSPR